MLTDHRSSWPRFSLKRLLLGMALVYVGLAIYRWWPAEGIGGRLFAMVWTDNTVWAPGYTNSVFRAVRVGMKRSEVYALLGQPLETNPLPGGGVIETWTNLGKDSFDCSIQFRRISFQGDVVIEKVAEFSPD